MAKRPCFSFAGSKLIGKTICRLQGDLGHKMWSDNRGNPAAITLTAGPSVDSSPKSSTSSIPRRTPSHWKSSVVHTWSMQGFSSGETVPHRGVATLWFRLETRSPETSSSPHEGGGPCSGHTRGAVGCRILEARGRGRGAPAEGRVVNGEVKGVEADVACSQRKKAVSHTPHPRTVGEKTRKGMSRQGRGGGADPGRGRR